MSNMVLGWPNRAADATYSAPDGAWTQASPVAYLATRKIAQVARAGTNDQRTAHVYLTTASPIECGVAALVGHNMTTTGQWRLRGFTADPRPAIDVSGCGGYLPSWMSVTRAQAGTYIGADGLLKTASANVARWEYDAAGRLLGLLVEKAGNNTLLYCRDGTNGVWTKTSMSTASTATGIDGAVGATRLTATAANANIRQNGGGASGIFSVYLRRVSGSGTVNISLNNFAAVTAVTLTSSWQRFTLAGTQSTLGVQIVTSGDVVEMDYAQSESGSVATSPILTTGSAGTRVADTIQIADAAARGAGFTAGALHIRARLIGVNADGDVLTLQESSSERLGIYLSSAGVLSARVTSAASLVANIPGPTKAAGDHINAAMSWQANDTRAAFDASSGTADTSCAMPTPSGTIQLVLGGAGASFHVETVRLWSTTLPDAQLQALSTNSDDCEVPSDYDSGWIAAWPAAWVSGTTAEERVGVTGCALYPPASPQTYQFWRIDLDDEDNPAPVELGRVFIGSKWQPQVNAVYGAAIGYEQRSTIVENDSGAEDFVARPAPRIVSIGFPALTDAEGLGQLLELVRRLGSTGEVLWQWDPSDTRYLPLRTFLARIRAASPLTAQFVDRHSVELEIKEIL